MSKKNSPDVLIVGSGFYGAVLAERIATKLNKKVLIIEKRNHIGGNCYSEIDKKTNIEYHKYGTHIFHTSNQRVWDYINKFTEFNNYRHQVLTKHKGKVFQMPINLETINSFFKKNFNPDQAVSFIKAKTKKLKRRDRLVSTEKIEDLEAKYFDQIKTLNAAPLKKSSKPKKLRSR